MTPQEAAVARGKEAVARGDLLYQERNKIQFMIYRLPLRDLVRLNECLAKLSEDDLKRVAAFAEALAAWSSTDVSQAPEAQQAEG